MQLDAERDSPRVRLERTPHRVAQTASGGFIWACRRSYDGTDDVPSATPPLAGCARLCSLAEIADDAPKWWSFPPSSNLVRRLKLPSPSTPPRARDADKVERDASVTGIANLRTADVRILTRSDREPSRLFRRANVHGSSASPSLAQLPSLSLWLASNRYTGGPSACISSSAELYKGGSRLFQPGSLPCGCRPCSPHSGPHDTPPGGESSSDAVLFYWFKEQPVLQI